MFAIIRKQHMIAAAAVLFALAMIPVGANRLQADAVQAAAGADTNWGLSFQKEGETPVGNASAEYLAQYSAWYAGDASEKTIYLTHLMRDMKPAIRRRFSIRLQSIR